MMGLFVGGLIVSILLVVAVCMVWRRVTTKVTQEDTVEVVQLSSEERQFWRWFNEQVRTAKEYEEFLAFSLHMNLELEVFLILKKDFKGDKIIISKLENMGFEIEYSENYRFMLKANADYAKYVRKINFPTFVEYFQKFLKCKEWNEPINIYNYLLSTLEGRRAYLFIENNYDEVRDFLEDLGFVISHRASFFTNDDYYSIERRK